MITYIPLNSKRPPIVFDTVDDVKDYVARRKGIPIKEVFLVDDNICIGREGNRDYIAWCGHPKIVGKIQYE